MADLTGGCLCGAVRYRVTGTPFNATICHCGACRRASGAPMLAWFTIRCNEFVPTAGVARQFRSSDHGTRGFCGACGTALTFASTRFPDEIDVTTASLDDPEAVPPQSRIYTESRIGWTDGMEALPARFGE